MLTKTDLRLIANLIDERMDKKLDEKLAPIHKELEKHTRILSRHDKSLREIKRTQAVMLEVLDGEQMRQRNRLTIVEEKLGISSTN